MVENPNVFDKLSSFVSSGYTAFKTAFVSADLAIGIAQQGAGDLGLPKVFGSAIATILMVIVFIGIAVSAILKWRS